MKLSLRDARGVTIGIEFAVSILVCMAAGAWIDKHYGTTPWCALVGIIIGFTAGIRSLLRLGKQASRDDTPSKNDESGPRSPSD